ISPIWERTEQNLKIFKELGFKNAPIHMHPELTWELDITPSENDLLMSMRKTTRYLIRQAMKNQDIKIYQSNNLKDVGRFNKLYQETVKRHDFAPFSLNYLKNEFLAFSPDNQVLIFLGKHQNKVLSSAIVIYWQNIGFYHQGASVASKIPVSYLMQWKAIMQAKQNGCKTYNFWGVAPTDNKKHAWAGLTLFKKGFGGNKIEYAKTQDYIVSSKYYLNFLVETIRKRKRHF
ncbi:MAG: peptidoglycan bridge formation glycyltransferase FemA/FemB family protein, partial [Candidatus Pacebacteria bacterium]|nr:peptidoglycan bridge formation glycyltransferase FemA/FemB family protein [Candidatus Paceibacterota bacterium]